MSSAYKEVSTDWRGAVRKGRILFLAGQAANIIGYAGIMAVCLALKLVQDRRGVAR